MAGTMAVAAVPVTPVARAGAGIGTRIDFTPLVQNIRRDEVGFVLARRHLLGRGVAD